MAGVKPSQLIFLDESGFHLGMLRRYARSLRGTRAYDFAPSNRGTNQTVIGAISLDGVMAEMRLEGGMTGDMFLAWVREWLVPELKPGQVVLMDNFSSHKVEGIEEAIKSAKAKLVRSSPLWVNMV